MLKANLAGLQGHSEAALLWIDECAEHIKEAPVLGIIIHAQRAKFALMDLQWAEAAISFDRAASVNIAAERRSMVPTCFFAAALCRMWANDLRAAHDNLQRVHEYVVLPKKNWPPSDEQAFRKAQSYLDNTGQISATLPSLLDLLELLEVKLHALRRMSSARLWSLFTLVNAVSPSSISPHVEARRLRYSGELARLLGKPHEEVCARLEEAQAELSHGRSTRFAGDISKDGAEALVHYSMAEVRFGQGDLASARSCCRAMQRSALGADFWVNLVFKAHNLEQRIDRWERAEGAACFDGGSPSMRPSSASRSRWRCCACRCRRSRKTE